MEKEQITIIDSIAKVAVLVLSGEDYFLRLRNIIASAKNEIHLQTYIFEDDSTGKEIAEALVNAAKRNVKVYVLVDGYGSTKLPADFIKKLRDCGVNIRFFSPLFSKNNFYIGRRLHHKVVVADGEKVLVGGINIANKYRGSNTQHPWLDFAVFIENETIGLDLQQLCRDIYFKKRRNKKRATPSVFLNDSSASIRILRNDWVKQKKEISKAYISAIQKAETEVIIVASYFLPGRKLSAALKKAAKRGVRVKIILSGVSDLPIVMFATHYLYSSLIKQGIELFEWKKSVLHGKLAVVDAKWTTIGSFNLNHLSSYGSIEMNTAISSQLFARNLSNHLYKVLDQCDVVTKEAFKIRNGILARFKYWLAYRFVRVVLIVMTYIPKKRLLNLY